MYKLSQIINPHPDFHAERLILLYRYMPIMAFGNITMSVLAYFLLDDFIPHFYLYSILTVNLLITVISQGYDFYVTSKALSDDTALTSRSFIKRSNYRYIITVGMIGIIWGSSALIFIDPINADYLDLSQQVIPTAIYLLLMVTTLGLSPVFGLVPGVFFSYSIPVMSPMIIILLTHPDPLYHWVGYGAVICLLTAIFLAWVSYLTAIKVFSLQHENTDLLKSLGIQAKDLEKANIDKSRFLASASHDLRQPLHTMGLYLGILQVESTTEKQRDVVKSLQKTFDVQSKLLNSLLDISRLDAGKIPVKLTYLNLRKPLEDLNDEFMLEATNKKLDFLVDYCDCVVLTDADLLQSILRNLISNAIHYTKAGFVHVLCERQAKYLLIKIIDTGVGIPDMEKENVFSEFYQINNPERDRAKGLGLGLAIVKRLCVLLSHKVTFQSSPGRGTCFTLQLSLGELEDVLVEETSSANMLIPISGKHIMVIDDESDILTAMQNLVESWACQFTSASSAEEALMIIDQGASPDIIISDYRLPGKTGLECIKAIRALLSTNIPALLISGDTDPEILKIIGKADLQLLHKPVKPAQLRIAITQLLAK